MLFSATKETTPTFPSAPHPQPVSWKLPELPEKTWFHLQWPSRKKCQSEGEYRLALEGALRLPASCERCDAESPKSAFSLEMVGCSFPFKTTPQRVPSKKQTYCGWPRSCTTYESLESFGSLAFGSQSVVSTPAVCTKNRLPIRSQGRVAVLSTRFVSQKQEHRLPAS